MITIPDDYKEVDTIYALKCLYDGERVLATLYSHDDKIYAAQVYQIDKGLSQNVNLSDLIEYVIEGQWYVQE